VQGLLLAKGPGIMKGYYNDEANTAKAFSAGNGWFDTGDLGWRAPSEYLCDRFSKLAQRVIGFCKLYCPLLLGPC